MLRMLAFRPETGARDRSAPQAAAALSKPAAAPRSKTSGASRAAAPKPEPEPEPRPGTSGASAPQSEKGDWAEIVAQLNLVALTLELANNCALQEVTDSVVRLSLDPSHSHLKSESRIRQIEAALGRYYGHSVKLSISDTTELPGETPARRREREQNERQARAVESIEQDENIRALQDTFDATINYDSIRPRD
jgi:DNA polymerase-3 subunit gamma/tau